MPKTTRRTFLLSGAGVLASSLIGCGDSRNGYVASYSLFTLPLDNGVLTLGFNQIFAFELTAAYDLTVDALIMDILASPTVDIAGMEIRDETTNTLPNSVIRFGFIPTYPLRVQVPVNQFILGGRKKVFVVYVDVVRFNRSNNLQAVLLDIAGRSNGVPITPLGAPIQGPTKASNP